MDRNNALQIKAIRVVISTFETLPSDPPVAGNRLWGGHCRLGGEYGWSGPWYVASHGSLGGNLALRAEHSRAGPHPGLHTSLPVAASGRVSGGAKVSGMPLGGIRHSVSRLLQGDITMKQQAYTFSSAQHAGVALPYLLFVPRAYGVNPHQRWPLILFLHGKGERGDDLTLVRRHGIAKVVEEQEDFPFFAVSPQCPLETDWTPHHATLIALVDDLLARYAILGLKTLFGTRA